MAQRRTDSLVLNFSSIAGKLCKPLGLLAAAGLLAACTTTGGTGSTGSGAFPDRIVAERGGFIPEGIEFDSNNRRLLVGSIADGSVYAIDGNGRLQEVVSDSQLIASVGIEADEVRNRLLVANSNTRIEQGDAMLGVYELDSGAPIAMVDLADAIEDRPADAAHFANDVAVSTHGTAFVTDTRMNIVYRVDNYYNAEVLLDLGRDSGYNLNGIEFHPAGLLLVASPGNGKLLRVPVNNPQNWAEVDLELPMYGGDGLVWASDGGLVATSNNASRVLKYHSDDNWRSARLTGVASFSGQGTTAAAVDDDIYVVQPQFTSQDAPVILRARF
ncbi:MAG: SMP-30/gluconolactonase/LRE family protein [Pseudomonadales bacterium]|nr:SMP-30/gluconolactonase/LRE family protein [Pseudomonadales bacterium]